MDYVEGKPLKDESGKPILDEKNKPIPLPPPEELRLTFRCQQWNTLPISGGLLDQPAGLVERMTVAVNVYNSWKAWMTRDTKKDAHFAKDYPDAWNIVQMVLRLRTHG